MILSARAESIILSVPPAESMILSAPPERRWKTPAAQWAGGREAIALGDGHDGLRNVIGTKYFFVLQTCVYLEEPVRVASSARINLEEPVRVPG